MHEFIEIYKVIHNYLHENAGNASVSLFSQLKDEPHGLLYIQ